MVAHTLLITPSAAIEPLTCDGCAVTHPDVHPFRVAPGSPQFHLCTLCEEREIEAYEATQEADADWADFTGQPFDG